jgi:hypothetical protein
MNKITNTQIAEIAKNNDIEYAAMKAFGSVESGGEGFATDTGKLLIQFEPAWYKKQAPYAPSGLWSLNGVEKQSKEYAAFSDAFSKDKHAAMMSTSIGMYQIMGFHFATLGYPTVDAMWDDFKLGEYQQTLAVVRFIKANPKLYKALRLKDWDTVASIYNGAAYKTMAVKWGREPYDISMAKAYAKYSTK